MPETRAKIRVGVSTCLLGQAVRFDGGHKRDRFIVDTLGDYFAWHPVCPEIEVGMGTPRESVQLVRSATDPRMIAPRSGRDWTDAMNEYSQERVGQLQAERLRGYILKKDSPTCGMARVKLYDQNGVPGRMGVGLYAQQLMEALPNLPIEEEGRLNDAQLRENFVTRVFAYNRWRSMREAEPNPSGLIQFHAGHKLLIMAHNEALMREMGRLVANMSGLDFENTLDQYESLLMRALKCPSSRKRHVNVLQHLAGFLKEALTSSEKEELDGIFDEYKHGWAPLITPMTLLEHHLKKIDNAWVQAQHYLQPYPRSLALRSQI